VLKAAAAAAAAAAPQDGRAGPPGATGGRKQAKVLPDKQQPQQLQPQRIFPELFSHLPQYRVENVSLLLQCSVAFSREEYACPPIRVTCSSLNALHSCINVGADTGQRAVLSYRKPGKAF
jgi:hypothetical protein